MTNRRWNVLIVILFLVFAGLLAQFIRSTLHIQELVEPLMSGHTGSASYRHIALISQERDNPYWRSVEQGAREAAAQFGMQLEYTGPFRINPAEQTKLLEKAIASKAAAIVVQGMNDPVHAALINDAMDRGIPVITVDTDEPQSRRLSYVGTNNFEAGQLMGELVAEASGGQGLIGVLVGNAQADNQRLRLEGFQSVISRHPGLRIAEVRSTNISRLQAVQQAQELLTGKPGVTHMVGFSALDGIGMMEAAARVELQMRGMDIFAFDDVAETVEGIRQGHILLTLVQQPHQMGYESVALLHEYFQGTKPDPYHYTDISRLDRTGAAKGVNNQ
jgi:ribose transport system substrate-binding protein